MDAHPWRGPGRVALTDNECGNRPGVYWRGDTLGHIGEVRHRVPVRRGKDRTSRGRREGLQAQQNTVDSKPSNQPRRPEAGDPSQVRSIYSRRQLILHRANLRSQPRQELGIRVGKFSAQPGEHTRDAQFGKLFGSDGEAGLRAVIAPQRVDEAIQSVWPFSHHVPRR